MCLVCHAILRSHCVAGGDARDKFRQISDCAKKYSKDQKEKYTQHMKLKNIVQSNENTLNDRATTTNTFMKVVKFYGFHHSTFGDITLHKFQFEGNANSAQLGQRLTADVF